LINVAKIGIVVNIKANNNVVQMLVLNQVLHILCTSCIFLVSNGFNTTSVTCNRPNRPFKKIVRKKQEPSSSILTIATVCGYTTASS